MVDFLSGGWVSGFFWDGARHGLREMAGSYDIQFSKKNRAVIGAGTGCDNQWEGIPELTGRHIALKRRGVRLFIKRLGVGEIFINGKKVRLGQWCEIARSDQISIGASRRILNLQSGVFDARPLMGLESQALRYKDKGRVLCDGIFLRARPGTVTAVMGPSGCGKSVFLNLINGYNKPLSGKVFLTEYAMNSVKPVADVHKNYDSVRDRIGYVPQSDIMIPELTVRQSLRYRLKLRFPDMKRSVADKYIKETCESLGFKDPLAREEFLDTRIGSADSKGRVLSGGQRRRANIAHELVVKPQVLLLDEPTSGLSSVDADLVIETLKRLAVDEQLSVVLVVHQPSAYAFDRFDRLMILDMIGHLVYYGAASDAVTYFSKLSGENFESHSPAEFILKVCDEAPTKQLLTRFKTAEYRPSTTAVPVKNDVRVSVDGQLGNTAARMFKDFLQSPSELMTLLYRNLRVFIADFGGFLLTFLQVPLIMLLMLAAFHNLMEDHKEDDRNFRRHYCLLAEVDRAEAIRGEDNAKISLSTTGALLEIFLANADEVEAEFENQYSTILRKRGYSREKAWEEVEVIQKRYASVMDKYSSPSASQRAIVLFSLILAAIWLGMMGSCIEIVKEKSIFNRESRTCIHVSTYLSAKVILKVAVVGIQMVLLAMLIAPHFPGMQELQSKRLLLSLWATGGLAAILGLFVSSFSTTQRMALMAVPLLLIPQILFGGFIRPVGMVNSSKWPERVGMATIQRWAFDSSLDCDSLGSSGVLVQSIDPKAYEKYKRWEIRSIQIDETGLQNIYFGDKFFGYGKSLGVMGAQGLALLVCTYGGLRRRK